MSQAPPTIVEAAGALVWRVRQHRLQLALVHRPRYRDWSWPKGKLEVGESPVEAAAREVAEEIGQDVVLGVPLPPLAYRLPDGRTKQVRYWAAQVAGRPEAAALRARPPVPLASREEIDQVRWLDVRAAAARLTRKADLVPLEVLVEAYQHHRLDTRALLVVRHGAAHKRSMWSGTEHDRPLTEDGHRQAGALVPMFSAFGVTRIVSSAWIRCADTVEPYARATGVEVATSPLLTESSHEDSPAHVAATVTELLGSDQDSVLCTHRPVLPTVLDVVAAHSRRPVADALPHRDPFLHTGELLVAHVARTEQGPRVVAVEQHRP